MPENLYSSQKAEIGTAHGINCADTGLISENRLKYHAQGDTLIRYAVLFFRTELRYEIKGTQLQKVRDEEKTTCASGCYHAFAETLYIMFDVVAGNLDLTCLTGAIENSDLLFGQKPWREWLRIQRFFLHKPKSASTSATSRELASKPSCVSRSVISYILRPFS